MLSYMIRGRRGEWKWDRRKKNRGNRDRRNNEEIGQEKEIRRYNNEWINVKEGNGILNKYLTNLYSKFFEEEYI